MNQPLSDHIHALLQQNKSEFELPANKVPLSSPTFGADEVLAAIDVLVSSRVTMGKKVLEFEAAFAKWIGAKHAVMVNSGSSANLLAVSALMSHHTPNRLERGDEVIVPAVTWPTTIFPLAQLGLVPVVVDVSPETFNISVEAIEKAISPKTRAVCIVPILGNPCDMDAIAALCRKHNLLLFEDTCESLGSSFKGKMCGTFGKVGTFSFFFSHHMTTMEGGMIITDDGELNEVLRSQRAHGWIRNHSQPAKMAAKYPELDPRFLFVDLGFNFRATDLQAAFGLKQLIKLEQMNQMRREVAGRIVAGLKKHERYIQLPRVQENGNHTWFGFPFLLRKDAGLTRQQVMDHLEAAGIETRPVTGGDLTQQPAFKLFEWRKGSPLTCANEIHTQGIYFGTHPGMKAAHCDHVIKTFDQLFSKG